MQLVKQGTGPRGVRAELAGKSGQDFVVNDG